MRPGSLRLLKVAALVAVVGASVFAPTWSLGISPDRSRPASAASASSLTLLRAAAPSRRTHARRVGAPSNPSPTFAPVAAPRPAQVQTPLTRTAVPARLSAPRPAPAVAARAPAPKPASPPPPPSRPPEPIQASPALLSESAPSDSALRRLQRHDEQTTTPTAQRSGSNDGGKSKNKGKGKDKSTSKDQSKSKDHENDTGKSKDKGNGKDKGKDKGNDSGDGSDKGKDQNKSNDKGKSKK